MKAVIIAGGRGTRMAPLTDKLPKVLLPVPPLEGEPLLLRQIAHLADHGFDDIAVTTGHLGYMVEDALDKIGTDEPVTVRCYQETEPMGTAGCLIALREFLDEPFLVLYGDIIPRGDIGGLVASHTSIATIGFVWKQLPDGYLMLNDGEDDDDRVVSFEEKPEIRVNAGVYMLDPEILDFIDKGDDFSAHVFPELIEAGRWIAGYEVGQVEDVSALYAEILL